MKEILKSLWRISKWLNIISIHELNQSRRYLNFKLIWSDKFFQIDLNRNNWVNSLIHSKFNQIDWNWFIWQLNDLNEIFFNFSEFEWIEMILHNLESNIQMNTITVSSNIKLKNNQILSIIVKSLWNRIIDETTNWIIKQQHSHFLSN